MCKLCHKMCKNKAASPVCCVAAKLAQKSANHWINWPTRIPGLVNVLPVAQVVATAHQMNGRAA